MRMVVIQSYFKKCVRIAGGQFQTYGFESDLIPLGENLPSVLYRANKVEHE